jgi:hypothetical protein
MLRNAQEFLQQVLTPQLSQIPGAHATFLYGIVIPPSFAFPLRHTCGLAVKSFREWHPQLLTWRPWAKQSVVDKTTLKLGLSSTGRVQDIYLASARGSGRAQGMLTVNSSTTWRSWAQYIDAFVALPCPEWRGAPSPKQDLAMRVALDICGARPPPPLLPVLGLSTRS